MGNLHDELETRAKEVCREQGGRWTFKKKKLFRLLCESNKPLSAYEIVGTYAKRYGEPLPAMSVYRVLNFLLAAGLVHKLQTTNQYVVCSCGANGHSDGVMQFLICDRCQSVEEVTLSRQLLAALEAGHRHCDFTMESRQLEFHGVCADCRKMEE